MATEYDFSLPEVTCRSAHFASLNGKNSYCFGKFTPRFSFEALARGHLPGERVAYIYNVASLGP